MPAFARSSLSAGLLRLRQGRKDPIVYLPPNFRRKGHELFPNRRSRSATAWHPWETASRQNPRGGEIRIPRQRFHILRATARSHTFSGRLLTSEWSASARVPAVRVPRREE